MNKIIYILTGLILTKLTKNFLASIKEDDISDDYDNYVVEYREVNGDIAREIIRPPGIK